MKNIYMQEKFWIGAAHLLILNVIFSLAMQTN